MTRGGCLGFLTLRWGARIFCKTTRGKAPFPVFSLSPVLIKPHYNRSGGIGGPGGGRRGQPETRPKQG